MNINSTSPPEKRFSDDQKKWLGVKRGPEVPGCGVPVLGYGVPGCGERGVWWKTRRPVEKAGFRGKREVRWKTRDLVENAGSNAGNTGNHYFFAKMSTFLTKMRGQNIVS